MPLKLGTSAKTRAKNVAELIGAGKPKEQAVAIAYSVQRKAEGQRAVKPAKPKK